MTDDKNTPIPCLPMICPHCGEAGFEGTLELINHVGDHLSRLTVELGRQKMITAYLADRVMREKSATYADPLSLSVEQVLQEAEQAVREGWPG